MSLLILAFLTGGPYYDMIGRAGNNVGRRVRGRNVFSMRPAKSSRPATMAQLAVRFALGMVASWLSWVDTIIEIGFQQHDAGESAMNGAVSYNILNAVTGVYPNQTIDYPKVLFSRGHLSGPSAAVAVATEVAQLDLTWSNALDNGQGSLTDLATIVVYNSVKQVYAVKVGAAARSSMVYEMLLPASWSDDSVHAYMHFVAVDQKAVSTSFYLGTFVVL